MSDTPGWAIVAIPSQDDYVWKISSEKIPHMTILFLGQQIQNAENVQHVVEYLQHVADTSIHRFGISVDRRGTLGADNADVLFFEENYMSKKLLDARSYLLKDETIFEMYNSTDQYDGWTPHLTLGYPATPAKNDTRDYPGINWVNFDRLALWTGNYDGPTIELKSQFDYPIGDVAMSDGDLDRVLRHYGIKGMHWGIRRSLGSGGRVQKSASEQAARSTHTKGGLDGNTSTSADAERAAKAYAKAQKRGTSSLSNEELKALTARITAEKNFHSLTTDQKSSLQKQVETLRLQQEYRKLSAAEAEAKKSTGRKIIDSVLQSAKQTASDQAAAYGQKMIMDLLKQTGTSKSDVGFKKKSGPFKVNPDKVTFRPDTQHNLPKLLNHN